MVALLDNLGRIEFLVSLLDEALSGATYGGHMETVMLLLGYENNRPDQHE